MSTFFQEYMSSRPESYRRASWLLTHLFLRCFLSFFFSLSMSSLARRITSVISASMEMEGEEPGGWPWTAPCGVGYWDLEERRERLRRSDSFMASLSSSFDLRREEREDRGGHKPSSKLKASNTIFHPTKKRDIPDLLNLSDVVLD